MDCIHEYYHECYSGTVKSRLQFAHRLYRECGDYLLSDTQVSATLDALTQSAKALSFHMLQMGMGEICTKCSEKEGGGCCSLYMAGETDGIQLLMNILVGVDVHAVRNDTFECCYLGPSGCIFIFKPFFCLNYNCGEIIESGRGESSRGLADLTGKLLGQQHELEQMIHTKIKMMSNG